MPAGFQARPTELIVGIESDVLLLQAADPSESDETVPAQPALAEATLTAVLPPAAERPLVGIYSAYDRSRLVSVIELVSPGNKDRPETTNAFVEKRLFLLQDGVHVIVVDVISLPRQPIRRPILKRLGLEAADEASGLWASSYCSLPGSEPQPHLTVREWAKALQVGQSLPQLPLFLRADQQWVMVDLDKTYQATIQAGRYQPA